MTEPVVVNRYPKISVNKLAEYMEANPRRRKVIIHDAKYTKPFIITRYADARNSIKVFLENDYDNNFILDQIAVLRKKVGKNKHAEQDLKLSIQVLKLFAETDLSYLSPFNFTPPGGRAKTLKFSGVSVSAAPDLIVRKQTSKKNLIGAIKFHISKHNPLTDEGQRIVSLLLNIYTQNFILDEGMELSKKLCISFDLFRQSIESCPTAFKDRLLRVEAACEEIAARWGTL